VRLGKEIIQGGKTMKWNPYANQISWQARLAKETANEVFWTYLAVFAVAGSLMFVLSLLLGA
jgi:hypothetical protein